MALPASSPAKLFSRPPTTANSSVASSPPPFHTHHSARSFASLAPSDSRSNYRPPHSLNRALHPKHHPRARLKSFSPGLQDDQRPKPIPFGVRPDEIDLLAVEDPDELFQSFTVRELRALERRARTDAEHKQEDLRQMVGERYRDLLGAADSIVRMKTSSERLLEKLGRAEEECDREELKSRASAAGMSHSKSMASSSRTSYTLATLVKLLLDLSEHIWRSLEREDFLTAARFEALGRIISNELVSGSWDETGATEPGEVLELVPIVGRQTEALGQLAPQISWRAKVFLRKWEAEPRETLAALGAVVLLDNSTLLDSLALLLQARKTALNALVGRLSGSWMDEVKSAARLLVATLAHVQQIFASGQLASLLTAIQRGTAEDVQLGPILSLLPNAHQSMRYIPRSIIDFSPFVAALAESESVDPDRPTRAWFEQCQAELVAHVDSRLDQVCSSDILIDFRQKITEALGMRTAEDVKDTVGALQQRIVASMNQRFYQLYQDRLDRLRAETMSIFKAQSETPMGNWILEEKLPLLEASDPGKFARYLDSISNRIEGKLVESDSDGVVQRMERVGRLLRSDYERWREGGEENRDLYVGLGMRFVEGCLKDIEDVLENEINLSNVERQLRVGDLALQISSTRFSFMRDLSLRGDDEENRVELFDLFQTGLTAIVARSCEHWIKRTADQAIEIFEKEAKLQVQETYFLASSDPIYPSRSTYKSLDFLSTSLLKIGAHRLKAQQATIVPKLMDRFLAGVLSRFGELKMDRREKQVAFDLGVINAVAGRLEVGVNKVIEKVLGDLDLLTTQATVSSEVNNFILRVERIWWTLLVKPKVHDKKDQDQQPGSEREKKQQQQRIGGNIAGGDVGSRTVGIGEKKKGGVECVRPGNRFGLLSIY